MTLTINDINAGVVGLVEACRGEISENFLHVALTPEGAGFLVTFVLERESEVDREAIKDILTDFEGSYDQSPNIRFEVLVAPVNPLPPPFPARVIWVRKPRSSKVG